MQDLHNTVEKLSQLKDMEAVQSQILLVMCRRFPMVRISDSGSDWK